MPATLKTRTLSGAIVDQIRQDILAGTHAAGTQLRQDGLAAAFGVSRIPVREALFQLEAEGLVRIEPHRGAIVTSLSVAEVDDVFALRTLLEPRLLRASIPRLSQEDLEELDTIEAAFAAAVRQRDRSRWGELNARLHLSMYARAELPRSHAIVVGLLQTSDRYTRIQLATKAAWQRAQAEHGQLITLCRSRDVEAACALLVAHIEAVHADLREMIAQSG